MDGCDSNDLSQDALPLPAMPELETQSVTAESSSQNVFEQSDHTDQLYEMQDHPDEQTSPKRPRFQATGGNDSERQKKESVFSEISPPHDRWAFNLLIVNLSKNITEEEFRQMKEMYKGDIPRGALNRFKSPMDLFDMMQKTYCLTPLNLLQLEGLFWNIGRQDLMDMVIEYGRKTGNVIYMQPASLTPVNGYTAVKFHVCGKNFKDMTKNELCYLRTVVANTVLIPSSFVLVDGVDPSSSITVTILIPDQYAEILEKMILAKEIDMSELIEFGVDSITIRETVHQIAEIRATSLHAHTEQSQIEVAVKLQKAKHTISNLESEIMKQKDTINDLETQSLCLQAQNDTFKRSAKPNDLFPEAESIGEDPDVIGTAIPDALLKFSNTLEEMSKENCNKTLVLQLLQAHGTLIAARCYQELALIINKLVMQTQILTICQGTHVAIQHFMGGNISNLKETTPITALKEISDKLRPDELRILEKEYNCTKTDKEVLQKGQMPFLLFLLVNKSETSSTGAVNITEFLRKCLTKVNRTDLFIDFMEKIATFGDGDIKNTASTSTSASHVEEQTSRRDTKLEEILKQVEKISDKINKLDNKMHSVPEFGNVVKQMKGEYPILLYRV